MTGHAIHIKLDGRTYSGTYKVDRQLLTVTTNYGKKAGQVVPRKPHEALAQELLQGAAGQAPRGGTRRGGPTAALFLLCECLP